METNVNYTVVGIFVISLVAATVLAIIWLSAGLGLKDTTTYQINMRESVSGLDIDSPVEYNGVSVGSVKSLQLDLANPRLVVLLLQIKSDTPITQGTVATLKSRGITGITYVALSDDGTDLTPLKAYEGQEYPIIKTSPSLFLRLDTAMSKLSDNFQQITKAIDKLLDSENQRAFKELLANMRQASKEFSPLLKSTTAAMNTLESQTLPRTYEMLNNLDELSRNLVQVTGQIKQNPSVLIRGVEGPILGPGEK